MKKIVSFIILGMLALNAHSQDFINNPDYVYAQGIGKTQEDAENAALISLSRTLRVEVSCFTSHSIKEGDNITSEHFNKDVSTSSSMIFNDEVKTLVMHYSKNKYVVYKYINKKEYIDTHITAYRLYLNKAHESQARGIYDKHQKNIVLGYFYMAYSALDTPLMSVFGDYKALKDDIIRQDSIFYIKNNYGILNISEKMSGGYRIILTGGSSFMPMMGFEYEYNGVWRLPEKVFQGSYDEKSLTSDINGTEKYRGCYIKGDNTDISIHFLYEYSENGRFYKIDVPERWYFYNAKINNLKNI